MSNYRRKSKHKTEHIKKGFTVFQKTIATLASILGLITASITIMNALDKNKDHKDTTPQTTIIKEVQKEAPAESNAPAQSQSNNQETTQKEEVQTPSKKEHTKSDDNSFSFHFYHKKPGTNVPGFSFLKQDILHRMKIRT